MTHPHHALRDLVREVPDHLRVDHRAAWAAGARRRRRRRGALAVVLVAVVATLGALAGVIPAALPTPAPAGSTVAVSAHPTRLGHSWWVRSLPSRPGPMAGLVQHGGAGWYAVSATGHLWELPDLDTHNDVYPTLSPDGTRVGFLDAGGSYEIQDLVSGARTTFPSIGDGSLDGDVHRYDRNHAYGVDGQAPSFWSPDGTSLLTLGLRMADTKEGALAIGTDGSVRLVPAPGRDGAHVVGWTPSGAVGWLGADTSRDGLARHVSFTTTSPTGRTLSSRLLRGTPSDLDVSQWAGQLSPDGRQLASTTHDEAVTLYTYSTSTGRRTGSATGFGTADGPCSTFWLRGRPAVPAPTGTDSGGLASSTVLTTATGPVVVADPRLQVGCSVWAQSALDGPGASGPVGHLLGRRTAVWTWWWQEEVAGLALVAALALARRRRARRRTTAPSLGD